MFTLVRNFVALDVNMPPDVCGGEGAERRWLLPNSTSALSPFLKGLRLAVATFHPRQ